jgi:hypothetical protein
VAISNTTKEISNMETNTVTSRLKAITIFPVAILILLFGGAATGITTAVVGNFFYIALVFPLAMGFAGGNALTTAIQLAKIRKASHLLLMSALTAMIIYGMYHYGRYVGLQVQTSLEMFSGLTPATDDENLKVAKAFVDYALKQETGHPGFTGYMLYKAQQGVSLGRFYSSNRVHLGSLLTWLYWTLEFGIILWVVVIMGKKQTRIPLCESCGSRFGREKHLGGTVPANESLLLDLLERRDFIELGKLLERNADLPSTELYMQGCEACGKSSSHLTVRRAFRSSKGSLQFTDMLKTTLQPKDNMLLSQQLRFTGE